MGLFSGNKREYVVIAHRQDKVTEDYIVAMVKVSVYGEETDEEIIRIGAESMLSSSGYSYEVLRKHPDEVVFRIYPLTGRMGYRVGVGLHVEEIDG